MTFQVIWTNICIRDYLAPSIVLDQSDDSMFDHNYGFFIIAALLGFWDFKFTLFALGPIFVIGSYFYFLRIKDLSGDEHFNI